MNATLPAAPRPSVLSRPGLVSALSFGAVAILCLLLWSPWEGASRKGDRPLRFYCAAGMAKPITELMQKFEDATGIKVEITFGGSGKMLANIIAADGQGDLFLSADSLHINKAKELGLVQEIIPIATLRPALVVSKKTKEQFKRRGVPITSLKDLLRRDIKVVLANPEIASIGQISQKALAAQGLWKQLQADMAAFAARVSTVGTVNEVATAVSENDNTAGIIWTANAIQMHLEIIPVKELEPYEEPLQLGVLSKSKQPDAALTLARFLNAKDEGGAIFKRHQYEPTDQSDPWDPEPVIRIDAGAMLKPVLDPVVRRFQEREGVRVLTNYAGCGVLVSKMKGIKKDSSDHFPDAFFACEVSFLDQVQAWFDAGTLIARNDVVLVVAKGKEKEITELSDLRKPHVRIGLGHPEKSALGKLTDDILENLDLRDAVLEADRPQPIVFLPEGHLLVNQLRVRALDAIVVYRSNILATPGNEEHMTIVNPREPHAIARQPFAIAQDTKHRQLLLRFRDMILSAESQAQFSSRGFGWVGGKGK